MKGVPSPSRASGFRLFLRRQDGAALVEFAISLPTIMIILYAIIEMSRMLFAYQAAIGGVRDAARYFGRAIPADVCVDTVVAGVVTKTALAKWTDWVNSVSPSPNAVAAQIVGQKLANGAYVASVFPGAAALVGNPAVVVTRTCPNWNSPYAALSGTVPVVEVAANVRIDFPFGSVFSLLGDSLGGFTTTISDTSRVLGS